MPIIEPCTPEVLSKYLLTSLMTLYHWVVAALTMACSWCPHLGEHRRPLPSEGSFAVSVAPAAPFSRPG